MLWLLLLLLLLLLLSWLRRRRQRAGDGDGDAPPHELDEEARRVAGVVEAAVLAARPLLSGSIRRRPGWSRVARLHSSPSCFTRRPTQFATARTRSDTAKETRTPKGERGAKPPPPGRGRLRRRERASVGSWGLEDWI
uniref:Uncharacterized protein n=1 Tax=Oryza brachyantha TaxID=4533 RepID=J3L1Y0_ORYBR